MRVECPNCRMISPVGEDQIVASQNSINLSCPTCRFAMVLHLKSNLNSTDSPPELRNLSEDDLPSGLPAKDIRTQRGITALKAKILRSLVNLPSMPHIILRAREIISDPDSSLRDLARVIEIDQALVAKVLTLANSAYYGVSGMVSSIQHASVLLGQKTLAQMITILASSVLRNKKLRGYDIAPDDMWQHSLFCAFVLAKSSGFAAGQSATLDQIDPEILQFLRIELKDLDVVATSVQDDLQKIKEELKEV